MTTIIICIIAAFPLMIVFSLPSCSVDSMTLVNCILTYIATVMSLITIVNTFKNSRPKVIFKPKKIFKNEKHPFVSYFRYQSKIYILLCLTIANSSPHKTKIHDVFIESLEFQKKLKFCYFSKQYPVEPPKGLNQNKRFTFLNELTPVAKDFVVESFDTQKVYFIFLYRKLKIFNRKIFKFSADVTGIFGSQYFHFLINSKKLTTVRAPKKNKNYNGDTDQSEDPN